MKISPFRAIRATKPFIKTFSVSVYDAEAKEAALNLNRNNPHSFLNIINPQLFEEKALSHHDSYKRSVDKLNILLKEGILALEDAPALYIYRQVKKNDVYTGIIGLASVEEYQASKIKKHELTRSEKEKKMFDYMSAVRVSGNPVLLTYNDVPELGSYIKDKVEAAPEYHFTAEDGTEHMLWVLKERKELEKLEAFFKKAKDFYIADGHHRCAATSQLYPGVSTFMACLIPASQLRIHGFHRYVKDLNGLKTKELLDGLDKYFTVVKVKEGMPNKGEGIIGLFIKENWYEIHIPANLKKDPNPKHDLDVYILDHVIFGKIMGIKDSRTSSNIRYVNGETDLKTLIAPVKRGEVKAAFVLNPMSIADMVRVSDFGETMPPKSTWIEPKMRSGLLLNRF
jgi:uncharacterized protein (DUF1015 family)